MEASPGNQVPLYNTRCDRFGYTDASSKRIISLKTLSKFTGITSTSFVPEGAVNRQPPEGSNGVLCPASAA